MRGKRTFFGSTPFQPVPSPIPIAPTTIDLEYSQSTSMASQQQQLTLKLLVDKSSDKVLFAEAGKDVVDFLFSLLSIPVGTVVKLLATEGMPMVGCVGNLYKSVECLDDSCLQSGHARTMLLNPILPSASLPKHTLSLTGASPGGGALPADHASKFYRCYHSCGTCTSFCGTICPSCHNEMSTEMTRVDSDIEKEAAAATASVGEAGFVKGVVTYTVTDDLTVTQLSSISSITMLAKCNVGDLSSLEERVVKIGMKEESGGEGITLGDGSTIHNVERGRIELKMTSRKILPIHDILHVPSVGRNLISGSLLVTSE